jgi:hypothetical protein
MHPDPLGLLRRCRYSPTLADGNVFSLGGGGKWHVDTLTHNKSGIAYLSCGRCRYDQIVQAVLSRMTDTKVKSEEQQQTEEASPHALAEGPSGEAAGAAADADAGTDGMLDSSPSTMVWWAFLQLLQERYIERAPPCNLPPLLPKSSAPARAKKAAPKPGTCVQHHCSTGQDSTAECVNAQCGAPLASV